MKSRTTAAIVALLFGWTGAHRFYLGQSGLGAFYAMTTILGFPVFRIPLGVLLGVIDAVVFFLMSDEEFDKRYNDEDKGRRRKSRREGRRSTPKSRPERTRPQPSANARRPATSKKKKKNPFKLSGQKRLEAYELSGAIDDLNKSLSLYEEDPEVHYMLTRAHSLSEHADEAFFHLSRAVQYGLKDLDQIKTDEALAFLRVHKDFEAFEASGYTTLNAPSSTPRGVDDPTLLAQLERLAEMRRQGLITEQDYLLERQRLERKR